MSSPHGDDERDEGAHVEAARRSAGSPRGCWSPPRSAPSPSTPRGLADQAVTQASAMLAPRLSVPFVTALTALIATPAPADALPADAHHHH